MHAKKWDIKSGLIWRNSILVLGLLASLILSAAWVSWRLESRRWRSPQSVVEETGLRFPEHARITATQATLFSLSDGENYSWLIQSDNSLLPWAEAHMRPEMGGWEHIRQMSELGFPKEMPPNAKFSGVWRADQLTNQGREETSYLHLAEGGKVGILSTFRP